ncbi:MAG: hypothetical protein PHS77_12355 [Gallionellaceae bacterium]|nr:hypothetical protein [Gallionellaceae bacterium]MDD3530660.1 hypothetical protein [Gallionellaceae bacterium]
MKRDNNCVTNDWKGVTNTPYGGGFMSRTSCHVFIVTRHAVKESQ